MGLLSPWFLAGIAAVGLPVWLHLLRRYKRTPQPFSSLMFFERRVQSSVKHRRLRYLVLLAMRMALLMLLALTFANPFVNRTAARASRRKLAVIAIDRSFSMRYGNRMEQAKSEAHRVIGGLNGREMAQVIALDSSVENMTAPEIDRGVLNRAVDSIQADDAASSYGEFARALRMMDQTTGMELTVDFISDMQQTSMPAGFRDLQLGPHTTLRLHKVASGDAANWAVETVTTAARVYDSKHTRLAATIAGFTTQPAARSVSLVLDGRKIASKDVTVPANGRAQVEFLGFDVPYGMHKGEVRIAPEDKLPNDDSFAFSVTRSDPRRVLFLYADGRANEALYYKTAMESASDTGLTIEPKPIEQAPTDFSPYAFVVLSDVRELEQKVAQALCGYVSRGGAALVLVGPDTARAGRVPLSSDHASETRSTQGAGVVDTQHPALVGTGRFENVQFSDAARLIPKANARVIAKLADGAPLLVEEAMGEGRVLIFASTLDNSTNDFPLHASFVPFVVQTGHYLAGTQEAPSSVVSGTPIALRQTREQGTAADVIGPDGKHELSLNDAAKSLDFDLTQDGFYQVQRADGRRLLMAVDADRRESDLRTIPDETLALWRNTGNVSAVAQSGPVERQTQPWSLWRYAMILALAAALVESVFASRYLKEERQAA